MCHLILRKYFVLLALMGFLIPGARGQVFFLRDTFCSNQLLIVNGHLYGPDNPTGTEILPGGAANGADSIIEVRLVFFQPALLKLEQTLCQGDTVWVNGVPYHAGFNIGEETIENGAANGCDSIIQVMLTFRPRGIRDIIQPICEGDTLLINGTIYDAFHTSGEEVLAGGAAGGCDSVIRIALTPVPLPYSELRDTLCPDSFLVINGHQYDKNNRSGLERLPNASANGCDSLVNIRLFFRDLWVSLGDDIAISAGDTVCLDPFYNFQIGQLEWSPTLPCSTTLCLPFCQNYFSSTGIRLFATDASTGCVLSTQLRILVDENPPVYAPNVFKPGGTEPNNYFFLSAGPGIRQIRRFQILDRWGEILLERENIPANSPSEGWDGAWRGKVAPPGVYVFWAELEWWNGATKILSGSFTLIL